MSGHTPGPWRLDGTTRAVEAQAWDGSWKYVVDKVRGNNPSHAKANARLIAAAPDLLAAAKGMAWLKLNIHEYGSKEFRKFLEAAMEDSERAIAKADAK